MYFLMLYRVITNENIANWRENDITLLFLFHHPIVLSNRAYHLEARRTIVDKKKKKKTYAILS